MKIPYDHHSMIYNLYQNSNKIVWKAEEHNGQSQENLSPDSINLG